jgi:hypothetical protein
MSKYVKVYLDDERTAPDGWAQTFTADQTIVILSSGVVSYLSLDHDLGDDEKIGTGYDVLKWLEEKVFTNEYFIPPRTITVHSANVSARLKMEQAIVSIKAQNAKNIAWVREANP